MDLNVTMNQGSSNVSLAVVPVPESTYSKMKKMIPSPRGKRRSSTPSGTLVAKTFGIPLDDLVARDCHESGVPTVVHKMCQYILDNGIISEGIFRVNGNMKTVDRLKTQFDKNGDADLEEINDVMAVASLLKMFLRELPDSVIPYDMQPAFIKAHALRENKEQHLLVLRHLIQRMPQSNYDLLKYLINFLNRITDNSDSNKMTPVALAVVFGPNVFRCSETLQGLQEQACVNAITCKLIEQYLYLFSVDGQNQSETQSSSSTGSSSPRKKPARPPPPKFQQPMTSPTKICEDENSNMVGDENDSGLDGINKSDHEELIKEKSEVSGIKKRSSAQIFLFEPNRSKSPGSISRNGPSIMNASPSRKQIVDNTIRDAVKHNLFGSSVITSSSESDTQGNDALHSPDDKLAGDTTNKSPNIRDMLKRYTAGKLSKSADKKNKEVNESMESKSKDDDLNDEHSVIDQTTLDQMKDDWTGTLPSLTSNRAPPPRRRKGPRNERKTQSENIDEMLKQRSNGSIISEINEQKSIAKAENPLLVRIKNERMIKSFDDVNFEEDDNSPFTSPLISPKVKSPPTSIPIDDAQHENGGRPVVPPLDLLRVQQMDHADNVTRISPKERFSSILSDGPIRSPRDFQSHSEPERHDDHKQQVFHEKKQDTVPVLDMSAKDLKKRIDSLKKIIANFESSFQAQHQRLPKTSEKSQINKYMAELGRAKKQLRELLSSMKDYPDQTYQDVGFAPNSRDVKLRNKQPTKEETLNALLKRLTDKRNLSGRAEELEMLSPDQLKDEKLAVQKALLQYENLHGRPVSREDKTLMRPIYERYRRIKKLIAKLKDKDTEASGNHVDSARSDELQKDSLLGDEGTSGNSEAYTTESLNASKAGLTNDDDLNDTFNITRKPPDSNEKMLSDIESEDVVAGHEDKTQSMGEAVLHDATLDELLKQQKLAKKSKKSLGRTLKEFEDEFFVETGRKVQKDDRGPLEAEYSEYKQLRARLRLLDVLITKKKANQTV